MALGVRGGAAATEPELRGPCAGRRRAMLAVLALPHSARRRRGGVGHCWVSLSGSGVVCAAPQVGPLPGCRRPLGTYSDSDSGGRRRR